MTNRNVPLRGIADSTKHESAPPALNDPSGLDIWLKCGGGSDKSHCHGGYYGTWDSNKKQFTRTHLTGNQTSDAHLGRNGVTVTMGGHSYQGVWDTNKGENGHVWVSGSGDLERFNAEVTGNCGGTCNASGLLEESGSTGVKNRVLANAGEVLGAINKSRSDWCYNPVDIFHWRDGTLDRSYEARTGVNPSTAIPVPRAPGDTPVRFHVNALDWGGSPWGLAVHVESMGETIWGWF